MAAVLRMSLLIGVLAALASPAAAQGPELCGGKAIPVRIAEAVDGGSVKLSDGRVVRLASVIAPLPIDADRKAMLRAKTLLSEIVAAKDATLYLASEAKDRYGRLTALAIELEGKTWLEAKMLERGLARVFMPANEKCAAALLQFEALARNARKEFWSEAKFGVYDAQDIAALLAAEGRFVVVEGRVRRVGDSRRRLYLDFGRRFREDFTIIVPDTVRKTLTAQASDPKSWRGKRVRVRGIVISWGGPAIELNTAQAIELLE